MSFASLTGPSAKRVEVDNTVAPPAPASAGGDEGIASFRANPASAASAQMANSAVLTHCTNHASIGGFGAEYISPIMVGSEANLAGAGLARRKVCAEIEWWVRCWRPGSS